jgi:hypothetical protein
MPPQKKKLTRFVECKLLEVFDINSYRSDRQEYMSALIKNIQDVAQKDYGHITPRRIGKTVGNCVKRYAIEFTIYISSTFNRTLLHNHICLRLPT